MADQVFPLISGATLILPFLSYLRRRSGDHQRTILNKRHWSLSGWPGASHASRPCRLSNAAPPRQRRPPAPAPQPPNPSPRPGRRDKVLTSFKGRHTKTSTATRHRGQDPPRRQGRLEVRQLPVNREEDTHDPHDFGTRQRPAAPRRSTTRSPPPTGTAARPTTTRPTGSRTSTPHFMDLMFGEGESFKDFYLKQSNGRSSPRVTCPTGSPCPTTRRATAKPTASIDAQQPRYWTTSRTPPPPGTTRRRPRADRRQIKTYPRSSTGRPLRLRRRRRFNEPDGYIDHFQAIHAGEGEAAAAPGRDAIWSHPGTPTPPTPARPVRPATSRWRAARRPACGSVTTRPSPRTGPRRLRARVRSRPRSARPLRHRGRRQQHRLLDADERRLVAQPRHHSIGTTPLHGRVGEAAARLARLQGRAYGTDMTVKWPATWRARPTQALSSRCRAHVTPTTPPLRQASGGAARRQPQRHAPHGRPDGRQDLRVSLVRATSRRLRLPLREVSTDNGATGAVARRARPSRAQKSGTSRPTRARRSSSASASPLTVAFSEAFIDDIAVRHGAGARRRRGARGPPRVQIIDGTTTKQVQDVYYAETASTAATTRR